MWYVLQKDVTLPSQVVISNEIREKSDVMAKRYKKSLRHTLQVDYISYMDELAELAGCKPDLSKTSLFVSNTNNPITTIY